MAGNQAQYEQWLKDNGLTRREAPAISLPESIQGMTFQRGDVVRIGTYYERQDIAEIEENIRLSTRP